MTGTQPKGLRCSIYRPAEGDCSNGGISGRVDRVTLIGPDIPQIFPVSDDAPAVTIRVLGGAVNAVPVGERGWHMFGGCFIYTSDGRFPSSLPIALHDRVESADLARAFD